MFTFGRRQFQKSCSKGAPKPALVGPRRVPGTENPATYPFLRPLDHHGTLRHRVHPRVRPQRLHNFSQFLLPRDLWPLHALPSQSASKLVGPILARGPLLPGRHGPGSAQPAEDGTFGRRGRAGRAHRRWRQRRPFQMERGDWSVAGLRVGADWPARAGRQGRSAAIFKRRGMMKATELAFSATSATFATSFGQNYGAAVQSAAFLGLLG